MKASKSKGIITYIGIVAGVLLAAVVLLYGGNCLAIMLTNQANEHYMPYYLKEEPGFVSPWYEDGFHVVDEEFIDEIPKLKENDKSVIIMGSSMSVIPLKDEFLKLEDGFSTAKFVCGNGGWKSNLVMENLIEANGGFGEQDIVKYEISFSTFREVMTTITETILDKWGKYQVDEDLSVTEGSQLLTPVYEMNLWMLRIQNVWELFMFALEQRNAPEPIGLGNFKNNYFNYETVAVSCEMTAEMQQSVEEQLLRLQQKTNVLVEISCLPKGLQETDYGKQLNAYIDETLIPLLEEHGIPYLDYRNDYEDAEYADGVHLSYQAAKRYTEKLGEDLNTLITQP